MQRLWERLAHLQPIVSTVKADDLSQQPEVVRNSYEFIASLFYPFESIKRDLREPLLRRLKDSKPVIGYVSGEYGYGKTATMIWLWRECEANDIVAVPPFLFYGWDELTKATAAWLKFRLKEKRPDLADKADELLARFRSRAVDELAEDYARKERLPIERAKRIIEDLLRRGMLTLMNPSQIAEFLQEGSSLAQEGGFKGLIAFADEVQNFVDQPNMHERIEQLRMFVHAFRTMDCPAGLFWGLAARVEERLHEQAGDMMQRVQDYRAFLQLQGAYTRDFPRQLWKHLCDTYAPEAFEIVDDAALEALGQICERGDLSNGPRTVAASLRCVASWWQEKQQRYTVWQLVDDYEHRRIVFEGQEQTVTTTMRTLLSERVVQGNPDYQRAIRFLCLFPEGVHIKVAERYGVRKAIEELAEGWGFLGTHIYQPQHELFALTNLRRVRDGIDRLTELLRRFRNRWWHEYPEHTKAQTAKLGFINFVLPEIFPKRGSGEQGKWGGHPRLDEARDLISRKVADIVLEGTFDGTMMTFPDRKIVVAVSDDEQALSRWRTSESDIDLTFRLFLLNQPEDVAGQVVTTKGEPNLDFRLNMERHYDDYPSDLQIFRDIMLPQSITVKVLLNLAMFVMVETERRSLPESDRQSFETHLLRPAIRHAVQLLFPDKMQGIGVSVQGAGSSLIEHAFRQKCEEIFPDYSPLLTTRQSENDLQRYMKVLLQGKLSRGEKQGRRAVVWTQEELAKNLGVSASQRDAVVNRLKEMGLIKVREISTKEGRKLEVTFTEHPLEQKLRDWLQEFGAEVTVTVSGRRKKVKEIAYSDLHQRARRWGAYNDEIKAVLTLTEARGVLERVNGRVRESVFVEDPEAIRKEAEELRSLLDALRPYFRDDVRRFEGQVDEIVSKTYTEDEAQHEEARHALSQLQATLKEFAVQKAKQLEQEANDTVRKLHEHRVGLPLRELERRVEVSLRLAEWLDDQRRQLNRDLQRLSDELQKAAGEAERIRKLAETIARAEETKERLEGLKNTAEQMRKVKEQAEGALQRADGLKAYVDGFNRWKQLAMDADDFRDKLPDRYHDLRKRFDEWQEEVMEHFAERRREALKEHERFRLGLDELKHELAKRSQGEREAFQRLMEAYEKLFTAIVDHRLNTRYDPSDLEGSYDRLFSEVMEKFSGGLGRLGEFVQQDRARVAFLRVIRQQDVSELEREIEELDAQWHRFNQNLTFEVVKSFRDGDEQLPKLCDEIRQWISRRGEVQRRLNTADKPQPLDDGVERAFLDLMREVADRQRISGGIPLAHIWEAVVRNGAIPSDQLLTLIERLYRKGWLDITVSERK